MRLKKLELYGFKSFAQRTEIVFNEGITGIVGPNGSGKSNIGDAVRWVLGEQSAKTLRGASMSDVIFNGTQKRKPLSYCEVSLVFDNEDRALPMDFAEIMVTRRVYRNGDSEYFLNRSTCRLKDVIDLFRDTGIGKEGYSIIGQGRIDEILSRRSEDRRLVFEEAAGIVKFKTRKEEADKKLANTLENLDRLDNVLEELKRQLGPLEQQSRTAREYLEMSGELKILDMNLFILRTDKAKVRLAEMDEELNALTAILEEADRVMQEKSASRDEAEAAALELDARLSEEREKLNGIVGNVNETRLALSAIESRVKGREETRAQIEEEQKNSEARLAELAELFEAAGSEQDTQDALVADAEALLETAKKTAEKANREQEEAEANLEGKKNALLDAVNRASAAQNDQTRLSTMKETMGSRLEELEQGRAELAEQETTLAEDLSAAQEKLKQEQDTRQAMADRLRQCRADFDRQDSMLIELRRKYDETGKQLQDATSRKKLLEEMARELEGYSQSVRSAVRFASQRKLTGVYGVLSQLIRVPKEYETAIDMALGAAQQNIVTDTEETARQLIDYLRENRLGRATFLPVSAIRGKNLNGQEKSALRMEGCVGVASDLVECEERFRPIIENLLGRTVIARDLKCGIPIMRAGNHAFRLVTLAGDVMHAGGSMTGGSTQSRAVSFIGRTREITELGQAVERLQRLQGDLAEQVRGGQAKKEELRAAGNQALEELHQQEIAVAREQEHTDTASSRLEAHRSRIQATEDAVTQLTDAIREIDGQLQELSRRTDDVQLDRDAMEQEIQNLQEQVIILRGAAAEAADTVMNRTLQLAEMRHTLDSLRRDRTRYEQEQQQAESDRLRRQSRLKEMDDADARDAEETARLNAQIGVRQLEQTRQEQVISGLEGKRSELQKKQSALFTDMENLHQAYDRDSDKKHRAELARSRVENDLKQMNDRIWNTYELTYAGALEFRQEEGFDPVEADRRAAELSSRIRALGPVNVKAVEEYAETKERADELITQRQDLEKAEADLRELIGRLLQQMETTFVENFSRMQEYFSETFTKLFGGGHAELALLDPSDPLNCGIEVNAQPPGKKLQLLSLLSGGERALTAIAILFAMLKLKPTPFCILDEIEAALDDANIGYYADYLTEFSKGTQFIVVTHRKGTMERCNSLYGVAM